MTAEDFDHYREAEKLLRKAARYPDGSEQQHGLVSRAQVHAYLAATAATVKQVEQQSALAERTVTYMDAVQALMEAPPLAALTSEPQT